MASVLYLTDTRFGQRAWEHPSARHRCYHYADALLGDGANAAVLPVERVSPKILEAFEHVVFHRPSFNRRFTHALDCCDKAAVRIHADYDDLIFQPKYAQFGPLYINGNKNLEKVAGQFESNLKAAKCFSSFFTSTRFLQAQLKDAVVRAEIAVLPNSLPRIFQPPPMVDRKGSMVTIGYFPGSGGHGEDLKSIHSVLSQVLNDSVRLLIVGRIRADDYAGLPNVIHIPFTDYNNYLTLLSRVDISIAPLIDNIFNQSKSAVKLIESVAVGTPIIATDIQDMKDHDNPLATLVQSQTDWIVALTGLLTTIRADRDTVNSSSLNCEDNAKILAGRYSVGSRMSILYEQLQCSA